MPNFIEIGGVTRKPLVDLTRNDPGVIQNCHDFHERTQRGLGGGGGQGLQKAFQKCCLWCTAILRSGLKINIFKLSFWLGGRGHKNEYSGLMQEWFKDSPSHSLCGTLMLTIILDES